MTCRLKFVRGIVLLVYAVLLYSNYNINWIPSTSQCSSPLYAVVLYSRALCCYIEINKIRNRNIYSDKNEKAILKYIEITRKRQKYISTYINHCIIILTNCVDDLTVDVFLFFWIIFLFFITNLVSKPIFSFIKYSNVFTLLVYI